MPGIVSECFQTNLLSIYFRFWQIINGPLCQDQTQGLTSILILHLPSLGTLCSRGTSCGQFSHQILNPDCGSVIQNVQVREKTNNLNLWINFKCIYTISSIYWWCGLIVKLRSKSWLPRCLGVNMKSLFQYSGQLEILSKLSHLVWL